MRSTLDVGPTGQVLKALNFMSTSAIVPSIDELIVEEVDCDSDEHVFSESENELSDNEDEESPVPSLELNVDPNLPPMLRSLRVHSVSNIKDNNFDLGLSENDLLGGTVSS